MIRWPSRYVLMALLGACATSPALRYYTLGAAIEPAAEVAPDTASIWVAPVTLPEAVDRPQLVVRVAPNRVAILDQHRWAEPLAGALSRAIAGNLAALLGGARVSSETQHAASEAQVRVLVDFQRFESVPGQGVTIEVLWSVRRSTAPEPQRGRSVISEPLGEEPGARPGGPGYETLAAAHSRAVAALSRDIAQAISSR